jgi:filamentous hemagglutinin family protein
MDESTARSRQPDAIRKAFLWALLPTLALLLIAPDVGDAQVATHITPSALPACPGPCGAGVTIVTPPLLGTTVTTITGGARPGNGPNLFHSFGRFDVGNGDIANFFNDTGLPTSNILSRVTGGNPSQIYGTIQTTDFPGANLFLMNPAGVLFGPSGALDLGAVTGSAVRQPGSFYATTANYLNLVDENGTSSPFYADLALASVLSVAPVAAFGFTALNPVSITIEGSTLMVGQGQTLSIVGGNTPFNKTIQEDPLIEQPVPSGVTVTGGTLSAPGGQINLVSVASPGEMHIFGFPVPNIDGASFTSFGSVSLASGSHINVSGESTVSIRGGQIVLSVNDAVLTTLTTSQTPGLPETISLGPGSSIKTSNSGTGPGADVQLIASNVQIVDGAFISSETFGDGPGGNISITNAQTVNLRNFASISVATYGSGRGGDVVIAAGKVDLEDVSTITTQAYGPGRGGDVHITADSLTLKNRSEISTLNSGLGLVGGDLFLNVGTSLRLLGGPDGGSKIGSNNSTAFDLDDNGVVDVTGVGGNINITVQGTTQGPESTEHSVVLSGGSEISSDVCPACGSGGQISIRATSLDLDEASTIKSATAATEIDLNNDGVVDVTGRGGDIVVAVQQLRVVGGATITSNTSSTEVGAAAGGTVTVQGLAGPGSMASSVLLSGPNTGMVSNSNAGVPGEITVNAGTLTITNGAAIAAGSPISTGPGGKVTVTADSVLISADGQIFSRSVVQESGKVKITANELTLDNGSIDTNTSSESGNPGGNVELNGGTVSLTNGARINSQSETFSTGSAGNITITGKSLTLANHSEITSSSKGTVANAGDAGNITIHSGSTVVMNNSSITTEANQASGGQIKITAPEMVRLTNSRISTSVHDGTGGGGNITIDPQFVILQNSQIIAQAIGGSGGAINVTAGVFLADPNSVVDASSLQGPQGTVNIQSPVQNVGGQLTPMSQQFSSAAALLAQQCAARAADGKFSTFVVAGREGLPVEPGGFLASPSLTAELLGSSLSGRYPHIPIATITGLFQEYDARPIQLAQLGSACHR